MTAFLLLSFLVLSPALPPPDLPDTPAGHVAEAFLDAMGAGDEPTLRAFVTERLAAGLRDAHPMERHLSILSAMAADLGGATIVAFEEDGPHDLRVTLLGTDGERRSLLFRVESEPPHGLIGIDAAEVDP